MKRFLSCILALILVFSMAACGKPAPQPSVPQEVTVPAGTTAPTSPIKTDPTAVPTAPVPTETAPVETQPAETKPTEPKPTEPKPTEPKPTEPKPTEPKPTEPKPTEPKPTEPKPTEPKPTEPKPTEPKPTEPKPTEPKPTEPKPTEPKPTEPKPTEPKPTEPKPTEPKPTEPKPTEVPGTHTALPESQYYYYSTLNSTEKQLYNAIVAAVRELRNEVDVSGYGLDYDAVRAVADKAVADHPQFFYVSKLMSGLSVNGKLSSWILLYTDGSAVDSMGSDYKVVQKANRGKIQSQIASFEARVDQVIAAIPAVRDQVAMEKAAYDFLAETVTYDTVSASTNFNFEVDTPTCFDANGALMNGSAVCEGYAKLFQYLCYRMGINAIQVSGVANGGGHMWCMANINGKWYHVDPTWGDNDRNAMINYAYFNLTQAQISTDHTLDPGVSVPAATATEAHYSNTLCLRCNGDDQPIGNLENAVRYLGGQNLIYLYTGGAKLSNVFLSKILADPNSPLRAGLQSYGYDIDELGWRTFGELYCFTIKKI